MWKVGGSKVERFWITFRNMLLLGGDLVGKPILKVRTVKKVGETGNFFLFGGHCFDDGRPNISDMVYQSEQSPDACGDAWLNTAPAWKGSVAPYSHTIGQKFDNILRRYHQANMRLRGCCKLG